MLRFLVLINDSPENFFEVSTGLRYTVTLSAYLSIILAKVLGRTIKKEMHIARTKGIKVTSLVSPITNRPFFDNTMVFGMVKRRKA